MMLGRTAEKTIVFDTNVFISGYLWEGRAREAVRLIRGQEYRLLICREMLAELIRVLSSKFHFETDIIY